MMLCFDVFLNGKRLCRAAVGEAGVLTTIVSWAEGAAAKPRRGAYGRDRLNLHVGGLYHPDEETNIHPRWVDRSLRLGDRVTIRIVEASRADRAPRRTITTAAQIREQQRAYLHRMKKELETAPNATKRPRAAKSRDQSRARRRPRSR